MMFSRPVTWATPVRGPKRRHHRAISSAGVPANLSLGSDENIALRRFTAWGRSFFQRVLYKGYCWEGDVIECIGGQAIVLEGDAIDCTGTGYDTL